MSPDVFSVEVFAVLFGAVLQSLDDVVQIDAAADVKRRRRFFDDVQGCDAFHIDVSVVGSVLVENALSKYVKLKKIYKRKVGKMSLNAFEIFV
jgi:hypothetical protein